MKNFNIYDESSFPDEILIFYKKLKGFKLVVTILFVIVYVALLGKVIFSTNNNSTIYLIIIWWSIAFYFMFKDFAYKKPFLILNKTGFKYKNNQMVEWNKIKEAEFYNGTKDNSATYLKFYYQDDKLNRKLKFDENVSELELSSKEIEKLFNYYKDFVS